MSNELRLKSKLIREADPWSVDVSAFQIPLTVDENRAQEDLRNFLRRFAETKSAEEVADQDMVTLSCAGAVPRFNKNHITVRVGKGLFSRELEQGMIGMKQGETGTVLVKGEPVSVTIEGITREVLPEPTDELAARCGIAWIHTGEDIIKYCRGKQFDEALAEQGDNVYGLLMREVEENSAFELDPEEVEATQGKTLREICKNSWAKGRTLDEIPDEEFRENFQSSKEEFLNMWAGVGESMVRSALLGQAMRDRAGNPLTEADYERYLQRYVDMGKSAEEAREQHPVREFLVDTLAGEWMDEMERIAPERLKEGYV